ncbi:MAG: hypothetical protein QUU85_07140, partial [Candidatus Eisenbacteria bacterium]|nr:hypothetical protein [Candidatus Eisenbacteria bacterium]
MGGFPLPRDGESCPDPGVALDRLIARTEELRALVPELPDLSGPGAIEDGGLALLEILEGKQRQLIQNNIRLAGLRELTETLLRDPDEEKVLRTMSHYLRQAYGLAEVVVLSGTEQGGLRGYRARAGTGRLCEAIRWSPETIRQTAFERVLAGQPASGAAVPSPPGRPA